MQNSNKYTKQIAILFAALIFGLACGRDIKSDAFGFGGVGNPNEIPADGLDGGGTLEFIKLNTLIPGGPPFGTDDLLLGAGLLGDANVPGFAGTRILLASPLTPGAPNGGCYRSVQPNNFISEPINLVNAGPQIDMYVQPGDGTGNPLPLDRSTNPEFESILYVNGYQGFVADHGSPLRFAWPGPPLGEVLGFGTDTCPAGFQNTSECAFDSDIAMAGANLAIPDQIRGPGGTTPIVINKSPITDQPLPMGDDGWLFEWEPGTADTFAIVVEVFGAELVQGVGSPPPPPFNAPSPFIHQYADLVCATSDAQGSYFLDREEVSTFFNNFVDQPNFGKTACKDDNGLDDDDCWRGEDGNANGLLDTGEDINGNGVLDPVAGIAIMFYRQSLVPFKYDTQPLNDVTGVVRMVSLEYVLLDWQFGDPL